jgi:hypothetical protein
MRGGASPSHPTVRVRIRFPASVHTGPITGRFYVIFTKDARPDPRMQYLYSPRHAVPFFGVDVSQLRPGQVAVIDQDTPGYPIASIGDLPPGDYYVEAFANIYVEYHRADGHTIWAPPQWGPQIPEWEPGNLHSAVQHVHLSRSRDVTIDIALDKLVSADEFASLFPQQGYATDTPWIKHIRFESPLLSKFWGRPTYLGATILLPKGYDSHPGSHYPVVYYQQHFWAPVPWGFTTDQKTETPESIAHGKETGHGTGYEFYEAWNSDRFPRFLMVTFQHPCPYFDDSYAVNSANCGPFGDAIMNELIPYIETHFRVLREARARLLDGESTGGWEALALQVQHPKFFGGAWIYQPDPIDFSALQLVDIYKDANAFQAPYSTDWHTYDRPLQRNPDGQVLVTVRQTSRYEEVLGSHGRSEWQLDAWWAVFDPVGADGYPVPLWNMQTGVIDHGVANYIRDHGYDLVDYMRTHWPQVGPDLAGKLHFSVGDMDDNYLNLAVYKAQEFLESATNPAARATFVYGRPMKGHDWFPPTAAVLLTQMAAQVRAHAPPGESDAQWNY